MQVQLRGRPVVRKPFPSAVSDEEWAFVAPYVTRCRADGPRRKHELREVFDALRWTVKTGTQWRDLPNHFPPWTAVDQQAQRWLAAGVLEAMVRDFRVLLRFGEERAPEPTAGLVGARTRQSTRKSGTARATTGTSGRRARSCAWSSPPGPSALAQGNAGQ